MQHGRTVESFGERFPLLRREREGRLVGNDLLGPRAGAFEDEVGHIHAPDLRPGADEGFLRGTRAQIDAAAAGLVSRCHYSILPISLYSQCTRGKFAAGDSLFSSAF